MKYYGNLTNRFEENKMFCEEIKIGTEMTEYLYSDRHAYEVIEVKDQKHITVRKYDAKHIGEAYSNDWELVSNENNPTREMVKRGNYWYFAKTATLEDITSEDMDVRLWVALNGFNVDKIREKGQQTKYEKANVSFGIADEYYDYEF